MIIRSEQLSDHEAIFDLTKKAFENHPYSDNTEQFIINALRAAGALTISLVAEIDGTVVGHVAFSPVTFTDGSRNWYGLGPVAVLPERQRQGIGQALISEGLSMLQTMGADGCILVGDPLYYQRFGFVNPTGLAHEGVPPENLLVLPFDTTVPHGVVVFHEGFTAKE